MSSKASNGEGSIFRQKDGKWRGSLTVTLPDGTKKRPCKRFKTRRDADQWLTKIKADLQAGRPVLCSELTFGEYIVQWLEKYGCMAIRDSTKMNYYGYIRHIQRHCIKNAKLKDLTTDDLQDFLLFLQSAGQMDTDKPLSAKTLHNIMNMVHKALDHAVGRQLIYHNPADYIQLPRVTTPMMRVLTENEIGRFVAAMQGDSLQIALVLMLFCGLRLGEACALTHDDVRCDDGIHYLSITKSLNRISNFEARDGEPKTLLRIQETKTSKGKRQVPLLPEVADKVLSHMCWQKEQAEKSYGLYEENPYLVSNELGHFLDPGTVRKKLKAVAESIGITAFHPHCLRHTYASKAVKCGVPLPYLSDILGHESTSFTAKVYVTLDLEGRANAQAAMSELVKSTFKK
ncbi:tyrosine-type recombinase/integrase [Ruminococcus flavefaciens]|uniref:Site-specific recombinase XerD n=1 Tax=Ruminococcus flavefaciens TaxID=1265 RepID=A0A315Y1D6_RUMFL|nr:tyrosine-type recombinase/integrase [Ruminococcus flavefaciens]PWJ12265.1 site-specific recombinase XerD [Ruminococcus flavefaciens]SSA49755.1 Site-specific recombinase XerD [Ruminococcus flavefaciens]